MILKVRVGAATGPCISAVSGALPGPPAYMDKTGSVRCGLPAEVQGRYLMKSTDGPLESARIWCPRGRPGS
jgi:hypothetical protein